MQPIKTIIILLFLAAIVNSQAVTGGNQGFIGLQKQIQNNTKEVKQAVYKIEDVERGLEERFLIWQGRTIFATIISVFLSFTVSAYMQNRRRIKGRIKQEEYIDTLEATIIQDRKETIKILKNTTKQAEKHNEILVKALKNLETTEKYIKSIKADLSMDLSKRAIIMSILIGLTIGLIMGVNL